MDLRSSISVWAGDVSPTGLFDAVADASEDAVLSLDATASITSWPLSAERLFGVSESEAIGAPFAILFAEHALAEIESIFERVLAGDSVKRFETEAWRSDGRSMPISISASPVLDAHDTPLAMLLVVRDITEQRLAQALLADIEARVRDSEELAHVGSWLWDIETGTVQWSDELHRILGVDPLDFDGTFSSHLGMVHPDDRERVRARLNDSVVSAEHFEDEYRTVGPDGAVRRIHARAQATVGSTGTVLALRGIARAVTDVGLSSD